MKLFLKVVINASSYRKTNVIVHSCTKSFMYIIHQTKRTPQLFTDLEFVACVRFTISESLCILP